MTKSGNGFAEMSDYLGNLLDVGEVAKASLEEAAEFYVEKLMPEIPKSLIKNKEHMRDHVKVTIESDRVVVHFEDTSFYWRFPENGTTNQRAQHFASGTFEKHKKEIEEIMTRKVMKKQEGK